MKCFYHSSDLDGHCSGAIVKQEYADCEMIGIDYGNKFPWDSIEIRETVFMVDFSLPIEEMASLNQKCDLFWIDHHKSIIDDYDKTVLNIKGLRRIGIGACALVWEYLYPKRDIPYPVALLAEYDVWIHSNPDTIPFQYGLRIENTLPDSKIWNVILAEEYRLASMDKTIKDGKAIVRYNDQSDERYAKGTYFVTLFEGYSCIAINKALTNSLLFESIKFDKDIMIAFHWNGKNSCWVVTLYSDKEEIDVSIIAKKYGRGGHKGAAGFSCDYLPFLLN